MNPKAELGVQVVSWKPGLFAIRVGATSSLSQGGSEPLEAATPQSMAANRQDSVTTDGKTRTDLSGPTNETPNSNSCGARDPNHHPAVLASSLSLPEVLWVRAASPGV